MTSAGPTVALVAHRLAEADPTGIGRYYRELTLGLHRAAGRRIRVASPPEPVRPDWAPADLDVRTIAGPRKLRAGGWAAFGRPAVDRHLGHPDLVHVLHPWTAVPARAPLVVTIHDLMPSQRPEWHGRGERWLFTRGARFARDHARRVIVDSHHVAGVVGHELGVEEARLAVVPIGVGEEFRRRPAPEVVAATCRAHGVEPGTFLLAVGRVSDRKNVRVVVEALGRVAPDLLGPVALLLAGPPGIGAERVTTAVERLGLTGRVRVAGFVAHADLPVLTAAALALVHPSRDEGFGLTPLEAMAAGTPVIASDAGSIPEVVGGAARLVGPDDVDGWAAAITDLAGSPEQRAALVEAGTAQQAPYTWDRTAAATAAVHRSVLDGD